MSAASLRQVDDAHWELVGHLEFATVVGLWPQVEALVAQGGELTLSLAAVTQTNSAGLVLLLEMRDLARRVGCDLRFEDLPAAMLDLAKISRCERFIAEAA